MLIKPIISSTVQGAKLQDNMGDSFYMNGLVPSCGQVPINKAISKSSRVKVGVFAVADGFGHGKAAESAAYKTVSLMKKYHDKMSDVSLEAINPIIEGYANEVNGHVGDVGPNAGASFAMLIISQGVATAVNIGNSRIYSFKYGRLNRLSIDDTEAQHLLSVGAIRRDEAKGHPSRSIINKFLGSLPYGTELKPHISSPAPVENGDLFLISSNGLTDYLSDDRISYILSLKMSNERLAQRLISEAVAKGADDNITVMLVRSGRGVKKTRVVNGGLLKAIAVVVLSAVVLAFLVSLLFKDTKAPEPITEEQPETVEETPTPTPIPDDEFILRQD